MMTPWNLILDLKEVVLDFTYLSLFLVVGTLFRRYIPFFRKYLIPNNIIAGFMALFLGPQILGELWRTLGLPGMSVIPFDSDRLGIYVYHLLAITFISMGLRRKKKRFGKGPFSKAMACIMSYVLQATIGLLVAFLLIYTIKPDLFPGIGYLLTMGYGMGPGLAYSIGLGWEQYGFEGGGQVGLTFAAIGYLFAFFGGIGLIRFGIRKRKLQTISSMDDITHDIRTGIIHEEHHKKESAGKLTMAQEAIDTLSFQLAMVGLVYLGTYGITKLITGWLPPDLANTLWSFHFMIGILLSLLVRNVLDKMGKSYMIDEGLMSRLNGVAIDYLVVAAIAAISLPVLSEYWLPIVLMSGLGGLGTIFMLYWISYRAYDDYPFERFVSVFAEMTGTINSSLTLIRVMDPNFKTVIADDSIYGAAITIGLAFPMLFVLNIPTMFFSDNLFTGYWISIAIILVYTLFLVIIWRAVGYLKFKKQLD
ncbi:MAG: sodium/glutamate symporter [Candidatus Marinimicrobia bacterium]|nr:sodium/glutamate symporter [Candidatus Neomarinimicrobiota bacterium]